MTFFARSVEVSLTLGMSATIADMICAQRYTQKNMLKEHKKLQTHFNRYRALG